MGFLGPYALLRQLSIYAIFEVTENGEKRRVADPN
jgi:hypothetical protein